MSPWIGWVCWGFSLAVHFNVLLAYIIHGVSGFILFLPRKKKSWLWIVKK